MCLTRKISLVNLSKKFYRSLIYSGDHDMVIPFLATQAWIRSLKYSIVDDCRPWYTNGQVAGYTRTYSNAMTFATVKGVEGTQHQSTSLKNAFTCIVGGSLRDFSRNKPNKIKL
ncbi:hypothetical protein HN51_057392 [Arachis hypogaea]|nr:putative serine carboxypeptidase-like 52 [Arachis hypogaea]QHN80749.1 Serine carboxypeptidase-like [Arachis hypogaea]